MFAFSPTRAATVAEMGVSDNAGSNIQPLQSDEDVYDEFDNDHRVLTSSFDQAAFLMTSLPSPLRQKRSRPASFSRQALPALDFWVIHPSHILMALRSCHPPPI